MECILYGNAVLLGHKDILLHSTGVTGNTELYFTATSKHSRWNRGQGSANTGGQFFDWRLCSNKRLCSIYSAHLSFPYIRKQILACPICWLRLCGRGRGSGCDRSSTTPSSKIIICTDFGRCTALRIEASSTFRDDALIRKRSCG